MFDIPDTDYDQFMGRYSYRLALVFSDFAGIEPGQRVLDVGAGTGALTSELLRRGAQVAAAEPSPSFAQSLARRFPDVDVKSAPAEELPWPDGSFDAALAQLVIAFMSEPEHGLAEMRRVVKPGGVAAACMWDREQMDMLAAIDRTVRALGGDVPRRRFMSAGEIQELFGDDSEVELLAVEASYTGFDEFWGAFLHSAGPTRDWMSTLDEDGLAEARAELDRQLGRPEGEFSLTGRAWAVRATRA